MSLTRKQAITEVRLIRERGNGVPSSTRTLRFSGVLPLPRVYEYVDLRGWEFDGWRIEPWTLHSFAEETK